MSKLFQMGDVRNHPSRSGFDLSKKLAFTAKAGELLPVYWRLTYPGDKFNLSVESFTRTQPVTSAAFTRIREYFDWYWVPLRLLNKNLPQALVQMQNNPVQALSLDSSRSITTDLPYVSISNSASGTLNRLFQHLAWNASTSVEDYLVNMFGFKQSACSAKLFSYLGYGNFTTEPAGNGAGQLGLTTNSDYDLSPIIPLQVNILPLLAYQKIYADHFRFTQWENNEPYTYNMDYYQGGDVLNISSITNAPTGADTTFRDAFGDINSFWTLRYCNWQKDLFMGVLPNQQLGDVATVNVGDFSYDGSGSSILGYGVVGTEDATNNMVYVSPGTVPGSNPMSLTVSTPSQVTVGTRIGVQTNEGYLNQGLTPYLSSSFDIISLRVAEATQRWREISQCADQDYRSQIKAHFDVTLSAALSDSCMYVGGHASTIDISEVVNTNLQDNGETNIQGKGVGTSAGKESFSCDEHGILMCIYHAVPLLDYVLTGQKMELLYTDTESLPVPEFDRIGMETLPFTTFMNGWNLTSGAGISQLAQDVIGYVPRFVELKTDVDEVYGAFRSTLQNWVAPLNPTVLAEWLAASGTGSGSVWNTNYNFFKVNPSLLDAIFGVSCDSTWDTDQFLVNAMFNVNAVRNFDYDGMPY